MEVTCQKQLPKIKLETDRVEDDFIYVSINGVQLTDVQPFTPNIPEQVKKHIERLSAQPAVGPIRFSHTHHLLFQHVLQCGIMMMLKSSCCTSFWTPSPRGHLKDNITVRDTYCRTMTPPVIFQIGQPRHSAL